VQCSPDDLRSYLEDFDEYSFEHLDLFYEEDYQPSLCSDLDKGEDVAFLKHDACDKVFQLYHCGCSWETCPLSEVFSRENPFLRI
jgi:hypothetical protein